MKLEQLRTFLAVLGHGSFSRAAEQLGVSQSTVSAHIASLEDATKARLIDRGRGEAHATPHGSLLERYARRIVAMLEEAVRRMHEAEAAPSGPLVITASTMVAEHFMPAILRDYRELYPGVRVTLRVFDSQVALEELRSQRCDLALIGAPARDRRFESARFAFDDVILVGPIGGARKLRSSSDLADVPLILREPSSGTRTAVADLLVGADIDRPDVLQVGSTQAARRCVMFDLGYSFVSKHAVIDDVRARRMRIVKLPGTPVRRWFHAVRRRSRTPTHAARVFYELLEVPSKTQDTR